MSGEYLSRGETVIYSAPIPLGEDERKILSGFTLPKGVNKRINEFQAARYCALKSFEFFGIPLLDLPAIERSSPAWPPGFIGSLSHCDKMAVCVARKLGTIDLLGIDIEEVLSEDKAKSIVNSVASLQEQSYWSKSNFCLELTRLFSAKEAFYKAISPHCLCFIDFLEVSYKSMNTDEWELTLMSQREELKELNGTYWGSTLYKNNFVISLIQTSKRETSNVPM